MQDTVWTKYIGPEIMDLRYLPSGDYIVVVNYNQIFILDAHNGEIVRQMEDNIGKIYTMAISASGDTIATGNAYGYIILWDFNTGDSIATIDDYYSLERYCDPPNVYDIEFSSDGNYLITCGAFAYNSEKMVKGVVLIHDIKKDTLVKATIDSGMTCVAVSPVGDYFATGTLYEGTVDLWDIGTWEKVKTLGVHYGKISDIDFNNDGNFLLSCANVGTIKIFDVLKQEEKKQIHFMDNNSDVSSVAFSNDSQYFISTGGGDAGMYIKIWEMLNYELIYAYDYRNYFNYFGPSNVTLSPDNKYFATSSPAGISLWKARWEGNSIFEENSVHTNIIKPNPTQDNITIEFEINLPGYTNISILDSEGEIIDIFKQKYYDIGKYQEYYSTELLPTGIYFCHIEAPSYSSTIKFIVNK